MLKVHGTEGRILSIGNRIKPENAETKPCIQLLRLTGGNVLTMQEQELFSASEIKFNGNTIYENDISKHNYQLFELDFDEGFLLYSLDKKTAVISETLCLLASYCNWSTKIPFNEIFMREKGVPLLMNINKAVEGKSFHYDRDYSRGQMMVLPTGYTPSIPFASIYIDAESDVKVTEIADGVTELTGHIKNVGSFTTRAITGEASTEENAIKYSVGCIMLKPGGDPKTFLINTLFGSFGRLSAFLSAHTEQGSKIIKIKGMMAHGYYLYAEYNTEANNLRNVIMASTAEDLGLYLFKEFNTAA